MNCSAKPPTAANTPMKEQEKTVSAALIDNANGYCIASTWLQAVPPLGPNLRPGGDGSENDPGIRWWLEFIKARYGPAK